MAVSSRPQYLGTDITPDLHAYLSAISRYLPVRVKHTTGDTACKQEYVNHGLPGRPTGAHLIYHTGTDGFQMFADIDEADTETCPCRFTETGIDVIIEFIP